MKSLKLLLFLFVSMTLYFSCSPSKKITDVEVTLEDILQNMESNYIRINSYSGTGKIDLNLKSLKMTLQFSLQAIKPSTVYLDLYGPFGIEAASIYLKEDSLYVYNAMSNTLIKTSLTSPKLRDLQFLNHFNQMFLKSLFGYIDLNSMVSDSTLNVNSSDKVCVIKFNQQYRYDFCFDKSKRFLSDISYSSANSNENFLILFKELKNYGKIFFPSNIIFNDVARKENVSISFKSLEFNSVSDELEFNFPEDVKVIEW